MATVTDTQSLQSPFQAEDERLPAPLEFFRDDQIHPDNKAVLDEESRRWRLLSWWERIKLRWYVDSLARRLRKAGYNRLVVERERLKGEFLKARETFNADPSPENKRRVLKIILEGKQIVKQLAPLRSVYDNFEHYSGWLEYERENRAELREEKKREAQIRKEMRQEDKWLEALLIDVFRKTKGCHHIWHDDGKERTKTPNFERSVITPDAHYFYLSASKRTIFGWAWKLPYGVTVENLTSEEVLSNMRAATKRQVDVIWTARNQLIFRVSRLDSPDALPSMVRWQDAMKFYPKEQTHKFPYCIGVNEGRKFQWFNLVDDPHILIAGKSQSGKSNLANGIIGTLVSTHSPSELRLLLIDQKGGIEFSHWEELPHVLWDVVKTVEQVQPVLSRIVVTMRQRMALLERAKAKNIVDYNARVDEEQRLERIVVLIDEMNTFVGLGKLTEDIHNLIMLLVSQGRAVGLHVIACTQHPEVKVIPGRIKTNMSVRLCGAMPTIIASQIVLDNPEASRIANKPGRFAGVRGLDLFIFQVPYMPDGDIYGIVSSAKRLYQLVKENISSEPSAPLVTWDEQRVLKACLEWLNGKLSGEQLHKTLGAESPGERHLRRAVKRLIDQAAATGYLTRDDTGDKFRVVKLKRAYHCEPFERQSDQPDKKVIPKSDEAMSALPSDYQSAAD